MATRIMTLGDSISIQSPPNDYQSPLYSALLAARQSVLFVGSSNIVSPMFSEGHPGYKIGGSDPGASLTDNVAAYLAANPADYILLHAGVNDINNDAIDGAATATRMATLLSTIYTASKGTRVLVAKIMPTRTGGVFAGSQPTISVFNSLLPSVVAARIAAGQRVSLVDCHNDYDAANWFADDVHPDNNGAKFLAGRWRDTLFPLLPYQPHTELDWFNVRASYGRDR